MSDAAIDWKATAEMRAGIIADLASKLAAAESACREVVQYVKEIEGWHMDGALIDVVARLEPVLAGEGEALSDEDKADLADAREALKEPGRVPWDDVKKRLGLDKAARAPGPEGEA